MSDIKQYKFKGEIITDKHGVYFIDFPFDAHQEFGMKKQVPIKVWFDGYYERKSLLPKGQGKHWLTISSTVRNSIGKSDGDQVDMVVERDLDPRTVDIPEGLEWLLDNEPEMRNRYDKLNYSERKFFTDYIEATSDPDTRVNRINKLFEYLSRTRKNQKID